MTHSLGGILVRHYLEREEIFNLVNVFDRFVLHVVVKPLVGLDGSSISISGLPSHVFHDYVQYESVKHVHKGPDREWSHSGTNGFVSRMLASS